MPVDFQTLGIVATIIGGAVATAMYISTGFRTLERSMFRALDLHAKEDGTKFEKIGNRIQRLELKSFGFTHQDDNAG